MIQHLLLSVRFLDNRYHGQTDHGERPEWPPSPFRLFQALVAGNARGGVIRGELRDALQWLERLDPPSIIAPVARNGGEVLTYVLNNTSDTQWPPSRAPKMIRPMLLNGDRLVQYGWTYDASQPDSVSHAKTLSDAVRHINALGWGIDLAIGCGEVVDRLPDVKSSRTVHIPDRHNDGNRLSLRIPCPESLKSLEEAYRGFLRRYERPGVTEFESPPRFERWSYICGNTRPYVAFRLRRVDASDRPVSIRHQLIAPLAGMVKKACADAGHTVSAAEVAADILGHPSGASPHRVSILPLPTLRDGPTDGRIRRVLLAEPLGSDGRWRRILERALDGEALRPEEGEDRFPELLLERIRFRDDVLPRYVGASQVWASATPVLLPGYDDRRQHRGDHQRRLARAEQLICKAVRHAGIDAPASFEFSKVPYLSGTLHAHAYQPRGKLQHYPRYHVRITFDRSITGPLAIGAGRHCGFGVLAAVSV